MKQFTQRAFRNILIQTISYDIHVVLIIPWSQVRVLPGPPLILVCPRNSIRRLEGKTDKAGLIETFHAHERRVKHTVPAERLLVFQASDGWAPLCAFLGKPVPAEPYPRSNSREEFFELLAQGPAN